jgi:hypothetical protein
MSDSSLEIRNLLQQDRQIVAELLDNSAQLVLELETTHHWIHQTLENYKMLRSIGNNLSSMLDECRDHWGEGKKIFNREPAMKLFRTAVGLYRALPPITAKYVEQLSKRRRQRIMGEDLLEIEGLDPVMVANDKASVKRQFTELSELYSSLEKRISEIPEGLVPILQAPVAEPNGHREDSSIPGVQIGDKLTSGGNPQPPAASPDKPSAGADPTGSSPL